MNPAYFSLRQEELRFAAAGIKSRFELGQIIGECRIVHLFGADRTNFETAKATEAPRVVDSFTITGVDSPPGALFGAETAERAVSCRNNLRA